MTVPAPLQDALPRERFRRFMTQWPTGVAVVTATAGEDPVGCTVSALMSLSLEPPLLVVSLGTGSGTLDAIRTCGSFAVNMLGWEQRELCERFSRRPRSERFRGLDVRFHHGVPVLVRTAAAVVCTVTQTVPFADHVLVLGAPVWLWADDGQPPLVYHDRAYRRLSDEDRAGSEP